MSRTRTRNVPADIIIERFAISHPDGRVNMCAACIHCTHACMLAFGRSAFAPGLLRKRMRRKAGFDGWAIFAERGEGGLYRPIKFDEMQPY